MRITLRPVVEADEPLLRDWFAETRALELALLPADMATVFLDQQYVAQSTAFRSRFPNAEHAVIEDDGRPVGRVIVDRDDQRVHVVDITIAAQDRDRGIGTRVLTDLCDAARNSRTRLELTVRLDNPARRLYGRLGFTESWHDDVYARMIR